MPDDSSDLFVMKPFSSVFIPRPPTVYLISDLIAQGSLDILYGQPGCFKSMLAADMAVCIAAGIPWLGHLVAQCPVGWFDFDNGERLTQERFEALARAHGLPDTPLSYTSTPIHTLDATKSAEMGAFTDLILRHRYGLVGIDNLGIVSGGVDENSSQMIGVMAGFRSIVARTGATVLLMAHDRKAEAADGRAGDKLRGHSSIRAAVDLLLNVNRGTGRNSLIATVKSDKSRTIDVPPFTTQFQFTHKAGTGDLLTAQFAHGPAPHAELDQAILDAVSRIAEQTSKPAPVAELLSILENELAGESFAHGEKAINTRLLALYRSGKLKRTTGLHNALLYSL